MSAKDCCVMPHWPHIDNHSEGWSERMIDMAKKQVGVEKALEDSNKTELFRYLALKGEDPANIEQFKFVAAQTGPTTMAEYEAQAIEGLAMDKKFFVEFKTELYECLGRHCAVDFEKVGAEVQASIEEHLATLKEVSDKVEALRDGELDVGDGEDAVEKTRDELTDAREEIARRIVKALLKDCRAREHMDKLLVFREKAREPGEVARNASEQRRCIDGVIERLRQSVRGGRVQKSRCEHIKAETFRRLRAKEQECKRLVEELEREYAEHLKLTIIHGLQRISLEEFDNEHAAEQKLLEKHEAEAIPAKEKLEELQERASKTQAMATEQANNALALGAKKALPATKAGLLQKKAAQFVSERRSLMAEERIKAARAAQRTLIGAMREKEDAPLTTGRSGKAMKEKHERRVLIGQMQAQIHAAGEELESHFKQKQDIEADIERAGTQADALVAVQADAEGPIDEEATTNEASDKVNDAYPDPTGVYSDKYEEDSELLALPAPDVSDFADDAQLALPSTIDERPEDLLRKLKESEEGRRLLDTEHRQQLAEHRHALQVGAHTHIEDTAEGNDSAEVEEVEQAIAQQDMQDMHDGAGVSQHGVHRQPQDEEGDAGLPAETGQTKLEAEDLPQAQDAQEDKEQDAQEAKQQDAQEKLAQAQDVQQDKEPAAEGDAKDATLVGPSSQASGSCGNRSTSDNAGGTEGSDGEDAEDPSCHDFVHVGADDVEK